MPDGTGPSLIEQLAEKAAGWLSVTDVAYSLKYLRHFGYLGGPPTPETVAEAVLAFQRRFLLEADGEIGPRTVKAMLAPRCGLPDGLLVTEESRWRKRNLAYWVESHLPGLAVAAQNEILDAVCAAWSGAADIRFSRVAQRSGADIVIGTGNGRQEGFDGPQGVLAWAQLPPGDDRQLLLKMDLAETWALSARDRGILLFNVLTHEFGHLLGLDHSQKRGALMAPYYSPAIATPQTDDDVTRIQRLYGPATVPPTPIPPVPPVPTPPPGQPPAGYQVIQIAIQGRVTSGSIPGFKLVRNLEEEEP